MTGFEYSMIAGFVAILAFLWRLSERVSGVETRLGERIAKVEGMLQGLTSAAAVRPREPAE